jgi:hypothetical protein
MDSSDEHLTGTRQELSSINFANYFQSLVTTTINSAHSLKQLLAEYLDKATTVSF